MTTEPNRAQLPAAVREVLDRRCTCGHPLGEHRSGNPDDCMAVVSKTPTGGIRRRCACESFELA